MMSAFHHTKKWKSVSSAFRRSRLVDGKYRCRACGADGRYLRLEVDHITPLRTGGAPYDRQNLQLLCTACHIEKSRSECETVDPERGKWIDLLKSQ